MHIYKYILNIYIYIYINFKFPTHFCNGSNGLLKWEENYMFLLPWLNLKINFQNELVIWVANSAEMDENLGGKLLVQKMHLWNKFMAIY